MSDIRSGHDRTVTASDTAVGDDGDAPGISQTLTQSDLDEILNDPTMTIEEKRQHLEALAGQIDERGGIDRGGEFEPLSMQIGDALAMLADGGHAYGTPESVGMDPESRSDARAPDDDDNGPL